MSSLVWTDKDGDSFEAQVCGAAERSQGLMFAFTNTKSDGEAEVTAYVTAEQVEALIDFLRRNTLIDIPKTPEEVEQWLNET